MIVNGFVAPEESRKQMVDSRKSKKQLIEQLEELRHQVIELKNGSAEKSNSDITERGQAEEALTGYREHPEELVEERTAELRESETKTRAILNAMPDPIFRISRDGTFLSYKATNEDLYVSPSEFMGKRVCDVLPAELAQQTMHYIEQALQTGDMQVFEYQLPIGGNLRHYEARMVVNDEDAVLTITRDITEHKEAEEKLRRSEELYREQFEHALDAIFLADIRTGILVDCNRAALKLVGRTKSELIGQHQRILHPPDEVEEGFSKSFKQHLELRKGQVLEAKILTKQGRIRDVVVMANLVEIGSKELLRGTFRDITERKRAEEELQETKDLLEGTLNGIPDVIGVQDRDHTIIRYNAAGYALLNIEPKEAIGKKCYELISRNRPCETCATSMCYKSRKPERVEVFSKQLGVWLDVRAYPILDDNGKIIKVVEHLRDITETKRLQELESRAERLEMAGTIAGQVAHDFNNLLAPLMAYPELIRDELPRNHSTLEYLDQIEEASHKIADINQDLLAMGRRGHHNQEVLNLNTVVQHALSELEPYPETLAFEIDLSDDLADILGGGAQLHRMIGNLLHNAMDAMQDIGQITVKTENYYVDNVSIVYGRVPKGKYVKLTISDTGCGIPDDIIQKIFDPFFTSKTTDKKRGSGLGLSVVDAVVKDQNGHIDLSTKVGEGTSFYVYFPVTRKSADSRDSIEAFGGNESILVVDDDDTQREVSSRLLTKLGYDVSSVESGEQAIEFLRENPQDLVILDMVMPGGIDGAEIYRRILEVSPNQKAIIMSGFSESDRVIEAQKLGVGAFVRKPVTKSVIGTAVRTELDRQLIAVTQV